jgi:hypothetical protein
MVFIYEEKSAQNHDELEYLKIIIPTTKLLINYKSNKYEII